MIGRIRAGLGMSEPANIRRWGDLPRARWWWIRGIGAAARAGSAGNGPTSGTGRRTAVVTVLLFLAVSFTLGSAALGNEPARPSGRFAAERPVDADVSFVPPPPFKDEDMFPCTECHDEDMETDPTPRVLEMAHEEIVFTHDAAHRWCLDCHDADNRDKLHDAGGRLIEFSEVYNLCRQCHATQYRDWRMGAHGKRTGSWNGPKQQLLCSHCHNAHAPHFEPIPPMPPPTLPGDLR